MPSVGSQVYGPTDLRPGFGRQYRLARERGANRIGASRLHDLSQVLDVPVSFFFDDMDPVRAPAIPAGFAEPAAEAFDADPLRRRETVELVSAYYRIDDPALRRRLFELARALAVGAERPEAK